MIYAQTSSGGKIRRDVLIFEPHKLRHGAFLSDREVQNSTFSSVN